VNQLQVSPVEVSTIIGQGVNFLVALVAIAVALVNKKSRTPQDDQARMEFGFKVLQEQLSEAKKDAKTMEDTIEFLRKRDEEGFQEKRDKNTLILELETRIEEKNHIIRLQQERLNNIADKVQRGIVITLTDVFGDGVVRDLATIEDTLSPGQVDEFRHGLHSNDKD
jgi:hypothetical protein